METKGCTCKPVNTVRIENAVVDNLKKHVLTDENLMKLLELTNKELAKRTTSDEKQLTLLRKELSANEKRLDRLYDLLETGAMNQDDLSPRIRKLSARSEELKNLIQNLEFARETTPAKVQIRMDQLKRYVEDMRSLLLQGEYFERKSFLRSFIHRIEYEYPKVAVHYTFPISPKDSQFSEVLSIVKKSGPDLTLPKLL